MIKNRIKVYGINTDNSYKRCREYKGSNFSDSCAMNLLLVVDLEFDETIDK